MKIWNLLATAAVALAACSRPAPPPAVQSQLEQAQAPEAVQPAAAPSPTVVQSIMRSRPAVPVRRLTWVDAQVGADVARAVRAEQRRAELAGQTLLVYVGATWCEPCGYFHDAALAGKLDDKLGSLRILAFDADRDRDQLEANGYSSKMIPLFVVPGADAKATDARVAGAIKGPEAVDYLVPRLRALLAAAAPSAAPAAAPAVRPAK